MLDFHGIRFNGQGAPERFSFSLSLKDPMNLSLDLHERMEGDYGKMVEIIDRKMERLFKASDRGDRSLRFAAAQLFRVRDVAGFICENPACSFLKLETGKILVRGLSIEEKWLLIERLIEEHLALAPAAERDGQLGDPDSDLSLILQMVALFFMEQDEERPPVNIEMRFVRRQFPRTVWKKSDGFSSSSGSVWLPKNPYCSPSYLHYRIMRKTAPAFYDSPALAKKLPAPKENASAALQNSFIPDFFGGQPPDEIVLESKPSDNQNIQLPMMPETLAESLLALQKSIQKKYSYNGVNHFLGIFRQLSQSGPDNICRFDVKKHFKLVAKISRKGTCSDKQYSLFDNIFGRVSKLRVKRRRREDDCVKEIRNPFVLELGVESVSSGPLNQVKLLLLDPLFSPAPENHIRLGTHLNMIPDEIFRESVYKHPLLAGLFSFLTGAWINNFAEERGTLEKTTEEILEGCAFNVTPSSRHSFIKRISSELDYMKRQSYISEYVFIKEPTGNFRKDRHRVSASEGVARNIAARLSLEPAAAQGKLTA